MEEAAERLLEEALTQMDDAQSNQLNAWMGFITFHFDSNVFGYESQSLFATGQLTAQDENLQIYLQHFKP